MKHFGALIEHFGIMVVQHKNGSLPISMKRYFAVIFVKWSFNKKRTGCEFKYTFDVVFRQLWRITTRS